MIRRHEQAPVGSFGYAFAQMQEFAWLRQCDQLRDGIVRHGYAYLDGADAAFKTFLQQPHGVLTHLTNERILQYTLRDITSATGYICIQTLQSGHGPFAQGELLTIGHPEPVHGVVLRLNMDHTEARLWSHTQRTPDISLVRGSMETIIETASLLLLHEEVGNYTMLSRGETMSILDALTSEYSMASA